MRACGHVCVRACKQTMYECAHVCMCACVLVCLYACVFVCVLMSVRMRVLVHSEPVSEGCNHKRTSRIASVLALVVKCYPYIAACMHGDVYRYVYRHVFMYICTDCQ